MQVGLKIRDEGVDRALRRAVSRHGRQKLDHALSAIALEFLAKTKQLAPVGDYGGHGLQGSGTMQKIKNGFRVGYTAIYATVQDWPFRTNIVRIRPRRAKILYIPLTKRAANKPVGAKPTGLVLGGIVRVAGPTPRSTGATGKRADYILAEEARIKVKPYGSERGPNKYFSETFKRYVPKTIKRVGTLIPTLFT